MHAVFFLLHYYSSVKNAIGGENCYFFSQPVAQYSIPITAGTALLIIIIPPELFVL